MNKLSEALISWIVAKPKLNTVEIKGLPISTAGYTVSRDSGYNQANEETKDKLTRVYVDVKEIKNLIKNLPTSKRTILLSDIDSLAQDIADNIHKIVRFKDE